MSLVEVHKPIALATNELSGAARVRRPESVLIVIYTETGEFLLIERSKPAGYWQSVTGSLEWGEAPDQAARREVIEETGISDGVLKNLQWTQVYEISPAFGRDRIYPPGVTHNLEHAYALKLPQRAPVTLNPAEHLQYRWLSAQDAIETVSSHTNRAVIEQLRR
ncbi:MAG: dihydroneopterin triphosphate diphosphatase [Steroidobacteraceae bacterium]|jgi:dATP pyrophosphohydrolase